MVHVPLLSVPPDCLGQKLGSWKHGQYFDVHDLLDLHSIILRDHVTVAVVIIGVCIMMQKQR